MSLVWKFRILALVVAAPLAVVCSGNLAAELFRPGSKSHPIRATEELAARLAPLRSDIQAENALAIAHRALMGEATNDIAAASLRCALSMSPHHSRMWASAAALQSRTDAGAPSITELLKLSYYTGPHDLQIIPLRLGVATLGTALNDADLRELAKGDIGVLVSPIMTDGRRTLANEYARASGVGKSFIEEALRAIDPAALDSVRRPAL